MILHKYIQVFSQQQAVINGGMKIYLGDRKNDNFKRGKLLGLRATKIKNKMTTFPTSYLKTWTLLVLVLKFHN